MPFHSEKFVHSFDHDGLDTPSSIGYPMNYVPHDIAKCAAQDLQHYLDAHGQQLHDFHSPEASGAAGGKMMGVLVVKSVNGELGYLSGFSGQLGGKTQVKGFVPPIYDLLSKDSFFLEGEAVITEMNDRYNKLKEEHGPVEEKLEDLKSMRDAELGGEKERMKVSKARRKEIRDNNPGKEIVDKLNRESAGERIHFKKKKAQWRERIEEIEKVKLRISDQLAAMENSRAERSNNLQQKLFDAYRIKNAQGETITLTELFDRARNALPPAAAGECAAPKLFQYAFEHNLTPVALAEFWWGAPDDKRVRKQGFYYPACKSKCEPILNFMLKGLEVDESPFARTNPLPEINVLFEDDHLIVVDKPAGVLSISGNTNLLSMVDWMSKKYPELVEATPVHRLDMDTSGILVIAKNTETLRNLQRQFEERKVVKEYIAILDGELQEKEGIIDLPLRPDIDDRPRQMVCYGHGKPAKTFYEVLEIERGKTMVRFRPETGRTHQLRVHASHPRGLNIPIEGDNLYGTTGKRLKLHAARIQFIHPVIGDELEVECNAAFAP